jgi:hypothetical protein
MLRARVREPAHARRVLRVPASLWRVRAAHATAVAKQYAGSGATAVSASGARDESTKKWARENASCECDDGKEYSADHVN